MLWMHIKHHTPDLIHCNNLSGKNVHVCNFESMPLQCATLAKAALRNAQNICAEKKQKKNIVKKKLARMGNNITSGKILHFPIKLRNFYNLYSIGYDFKRSRKKKPNVFQKNLYAADGRIFSSLVYFSTSHNWICSWRTMAINKRSQASNMIDAIS